MLHILICINLKGSGKMTEYAIILGAASGIGKACYKKMVSEYPNISYILVDKEVVNIRDNDKYIKTDLSNNKELEALLKKIDSLNGKIIFLVNSVGYQENIDVLDISKYDMLKMFETTVFSIFKIEQLVLKKMIKYQTNNQSIVNITSIHSNIIREIAHYSSAKAALTMLSKELAYRVAEHNIRINCIEPGSTLTPLLKKDLYNDTLINEAAKNIPMKRHAYPEEIAELAWFLVSEKSKYITGVSIQCDGGLSLII